MDLHNGSTVISETDRTDPRAGNTYYLTVVIIS